MYCFILLKSLEASVFRNNILYVFNYMIRFCLCPYSGSDFLSVNFILRVCFYDVTIDKSRLVWSLQLYIQKGQGASLPTEPTIFPEWTLAWVMCLEYGQNSIILTEPGCPVCTHLRQGTLMYFGSRSFKINSLKVSCIEIY